MYEPDQHGSKVAHFTLESALARLGSRTGAETPQGAFDTAEDFDRNNIIALAGARSQPFGQTRVWIDVGAQDPFVSVDSELARVLRAHGQKITFHVWPGSHSGSYWNKHVDRYLRFYADALADC
jgi:hypothetical protein